MAKSFLQNEPVDIANMLRQDHEEIRDRLARAMSYPSPVANVARRLSEICVPHFTLEERRRLLRYGVGCFCRRAVCVIRVRREIQHEGKPLTPLLNMRSRRAHIGGGPDEGGLLCDDGKA